jgi:hypothetical protein
MTTTPPEGEHEAVDHQPNPDYLALSAEEQAQLDEIVTNTQAMQNDIDKHIGIMGDAVFFMSRLLLQHELQLRTLRRRLEELEGQ